MANALQAATGVVAILWTTLVGAAEPPPVDAGSLLQQQQNLSEPRAPSPTVPRLRREAPRAAEAANAVRVRVRSFAIEGERQDLAFSRERLLAVLEPAIGQELTLPELRAVVERITDLYREAGYFLARAVLPPQDITDGRIVVRIQEGRLQPIDGVRIVPVAPMAPARVDAAPGSEASQSGASQRLDPDLARRIVGASLGADRPLVLSDVERGALLLNDVPGVSGGINLEPGDDPDTTRLVVDVAEQNLLHGTASADNYGSRYTNSRRLGLQAVADDPSGHGDQLALQLASSPDNGYHYAQLAYTVLASAQGLRVGVNVSGLHYRIGQELAPIDASGSATAVGAIARYPLLRSRETNVYLNGSFTQTQLRNYSLGTNTSDKRVRVTTGGVSADRSDAGGYTLADFAVSAGRLDLGANASSLALDQGPQGPRTQGTFAKVNLGVTRVQQVLPRLTVSALAVAQFASKNLESSEKFLLGGINGVRAYSSGEGAGDSGVRASIEARWKPPIDLPIGETSLLAFADWGRVRQFQKPRDLVLTTPDSVSLAGAGLGAVLVLPGRAELRALWAHRIGSNLGRNPVTNNDVDGRSNGNRFWLGLQVGF